MEVNILKFISCNNCRIQDICSIRGKYEKIYTDFIQSVEFQQNEHRFTPPQCKYYGYVMEAPNV